MSATESFPPASQRFPLVLAQSDVPRTTFLSVLGSKLELWMNFF